VGSPKRSPKAATEIAAYDREARSVELRSQGLNFSQIAGELDYASASGAAKAYHRALRRRPAQNVDMVRAQESERLEYLWKKTADLIENPTLVHSAIGKTVPDPRNPGEFLIDQSAQIRAIDEYRKLSESFRKLTGADVGTNVNVKVSTPEQEREMQEVQSFLDEWTRGVTSVQAENRTLQAENASLRAQVALLEGSVPAQLVTTDHGLYEKA
jgi:hypothetical protein